MEKEFKSLSEKEFIMDEEEGEPTREPEDHFGKEVIRENAFLSKDVKKFIKRLKTFYKGWGSKNELNAFLDKLAGSKLTERR